MSFNTFTENAEKEQNLKNPITVLSSTEIGMPCRSQILPCHHCVCVFSQQLEMCQDFYWPVHGIETFSLGKTSLKRRGPARFKGFCFAKYLLLILMGSFHDGGEFKLKTVICFQLYCNVFSGSFHRNGTIMCQYLRYSFILT